jgi:hypothetical protein
MYHEDRGAKRTNYKPLPELVLASLGRSQPRRERERERERLAFVLTNNDIPTGAMENLSPDYYETISHNKSAENRSKKLKDHADLSSVVGAWCLSVFRYRYYECKETEVRT